jgi:hypothetical protein
VNSGGFGAVLVSDLFDFFVCCGLDALGFQRLNDLFGVQAVCGADFLKR